MPRMLFRTSAVLLVLGAVLLVTALALKTSHASPAVAASAGPLAQSGEPASRWEYQTMVAKSAEDLAAQANRSGTDSWEMVNAVHVLNTNRYQWVGFFKRLKR